MTPGWAGPAWGQPSAASAAPVPRRPTVAAEDAAYRAEGGMSAGLVVLAASVAGVSHRLAERRNEDSLAWSSAGPGRLAVAVADGVSSAGRGGEGAALAVRAASQWTAAHVPRVPAHGEARDVTGCTSALVAANERLLLAQPGRPAGPGSELATTLVAGLVEQAPGGRARACLARVGDSTGFVLSAGRTWREVFLPGGDDGPATDALPHPALGLDADVVQVVEVDLEPGEALVLVTDGVANPLRDGPSTVAPALGGVVAEAAVGRVSPVGLLAALDFSRRGAHDDRTLLLVSSWPEHGA